MADFSNPYRPAPGSEPPELAGRDRELGAAGYAIEMARAGAPPNPIVFVGLRGMGKTALLRHVVREARGAGAVVVVAEADRSLRLSDVLRRDLTGALAGADSMPSRLASALGRIVSRLPKLAYELPHDAGAISVEGSGVADATPDSIEDLLLELNDRLHEHGRFLVLAVDEIQEASRDDLLRFVRAVHATAGTDRPILFVGAGLPNSASALIAARTYAERWAYHRLGLLSRGDLVDAVDVPARARGVRWEDAALDELALVTSGYPYFVQEFAAAAWRRHAGDVVSRDDLVAVSPGVSATLDEALYGRLLGAPSPNEAAFALALDALGTGAHRADEVATQLGARSSAQMSSTRAALVRKGVIYLPQRGLVEFRLPMTSAYIERHRERLERTAARARRETQAP